MVPNAEVARAVAEAMIRGRQTPERMASYVLHVETDEKHPGKWVVWQGLPDPPPSKDGMIYLQAGGGGIEMKIDQCTGEVSDAHYSR
jgi:hypothetical protein